MLAGAVDEGGQRFLAAFGRGLEGVGGEESGDQLKLGVVGPFQCRVQGDRQVAALGPGEPVGEDDHAAVQQQDVPRRLVGCEEPAGELGAGLDLLPVRELQWCQQAAAAVGVEGSVCVGGPGAVDGEDVLARVGNGDLERLARALDCEHLRRGSEAESAKHASVQFTYLF